TVWFDVSDSQLGTVAKCLISSSFQFSLALYFVYAAKIHSGMSLCQHCCASPHTKISYYNYAFCCKSNPSAKPPQDPTSKKAPCSHAVCCVNCKEKHSASNQWCSYWPYYFN
ncbi:hypothetical protein AN958_10411, partial [Leucoagaricus sp. SymC.cos]